MRIVKHGHACVRLEHHGVTIVIDPGVFTSPDAVNGVSAVLVTHEHADHVDPTLVGRVAAPVFTVASVVPLLPDTVDLRVVAPDEEFTVAGFEVAVVGAAHAVTHPDRPTVSNSGFVVRAGGCGVFHPGDALTLPPTAVDVLAVPVSGPWLKVSGAVDFVRAVGAPLNLAIHDRHASPAGLDTAGSLISGLIGSAQEFRIVPDGTAIEL